jgi:hypothetical protein
VMPDSAATGNAGAAVASGPSREEQMRDADAAVGRANAQLDLAEHALAEARRAMPRDSDPMRFVLVSTRLSRADEERLGFYKKDVLLARQALLEVLKEKRKATVPQTLTASNEWVPVSPGGRR